MLYNRSRIGPESCARGKMSKIIRIYHVGGMNMFSFIALIRYSLIYSCIYRIWFVARASAIATHSREYQNVVLCLDVMCY